jgi:hypothetical protein
MPRDRGPHPGSSPGNTVEDPALRVADCAIAESAAELYSVAIRYPHGGERAGQRGYRARRHARGSQTSARIPHSQRLDRTRRGCLPRSEACWTHDGQDARKHAKRIARPGTCPKGLRRKRAGQRPFSVGGRCRIRTCVGIRRRIYRTPPQRPDQHVCTRRAALPHDIPTVRRVSDGVRLTGAARWRPEWRLGRYFPATDAATSGVRGKANRLPPPRVCATDIGHAIRPR